MKNHGDKDKKSSNMLRARPALISIIVDVFHGQTRLCLFLPEKTTRNEP